MGVALAVVLAEARKAGRVVDEHTARRGKCFALTITGDSMINAGIHDGDYVFVRKQLSAS